MDYTPQNAPVWWGPTNPFINPYDRPDGYVNPPWTVVHDPGLLTLLGLQEGDVITTALSFPIAIPPLSDLITKFRVYCFGTGIVELHLLEIPLGGVAVITQDDNLLTLKVVELQHELGEVPVESVAERIVEIEFTTGGEHHIDVVLERKIDPVELIPVGYGGGLRKIVLCGFDTPGESVDVRQNVDAPCTLEKSADGETWVPFANLQLCPPKIRQNKGKTQFFDGTTWQDLDDGGDERYDGDADSPYPDPPEGETGNCLAAENITAQLLTMLTQLHSGLEVGAVASLGGTIAAAIAAVALLPIALIGAGVLAIVSIGQSIGVAAVQAIIDSDDIDTFKCIVNCHAASDGSITASAFTAIKDDIDDQIGGTTAGIMKQWLDTLGPVGMTRIAASAGITTGDCGDCECNTVTCSMLFGLGSIDSPSTVFVGDTITIHSGNNAGANQYMAVEFSRCVTATVVSYTGWVTIGSPSGNPAWRDCSGTDHNTGPIDQPPDYLADNLECTRMYFGGAVSDPFSVTIRIDSFV